MLPILLLPPLLPPLRYVVSLRLLLLLLLLCIILLLCWRLLLLWLHGPESRSALFTRCWSLQCGCYPLHGCKVAGWSRLCRSRPAVPW